MSGSADRTVGFDLRLPLRALILAAWQERYNQSWRFSRAKLGLWLLLGEIGFAALVIWRLADQEPVESPALVPLFGLMQSALFAFLSLFLRGRERLYSGPVVQLIHLSPTPAVAVMLAEVLARLPRRLWSALLFTAALAPALPTASRIWALPLLAGAVLAGGLCGHLAALLALIAWVRVSPRSLGGIWLAAMVAILAIAYFMIYLLIAGVSPEQVAAALERAGAWLPVGMALLFGLPGLLMALRLFASPRSAGEAYREGWLGLVALGDGSGRPRSPRFPRIAPGRAGAVQALVWLMALRNWMTGLRLGLWLVCLAGITLVGPALGRLPAERQALVVLGLGLATGLLNFGEQFGGLFAADGPRSALFLVAGLGPRAWLLGKWLAALPMALASTVTTAVAAWVVGLPLAHGLLLTGLALAISLGCLTWLVGAAAFDAAPREQAAESDAMAAAFEQMPTRIGGTVGLAGALALGGAATWLAPAQPLLLLPLALLPLLALAAGYGRLRHLFHYGV